MIYARVYDQTVADDYYRAMSSVEKRLELIGTPEEPNDAISEDEREQLLELSDQLAEPDLSLDLRLNIVRKIRSVLGSKEVIETISTNSLQCLSLDHSPP